MDNLNNFEGTKTILGFSILGVIVAVTVAYFANEQTSQLAGLPNADLDQIVTGSVRKKPQATGQGNKVHYKIRRSVLQKYPAEPCYIYSTGEQSGDC